MTSTIPPTEAIINSPCQDGLQDKQRKDVVDRFFGFTERMVCATNNRTNVELDPVLLKEDEAKGLTRGHRNAADVVHDELDLATNSIVAEDDDGDKGGAPTETSTPTKDTTEPTKPKTRSDLFDRFFGFTEGMVCVKDNTTDFELDAELLRQQEQAAGLSCGERNTAAVVEEETRSEEGQEEEPIIEDKLGEKLEEKLEQKESDVSGNTDTETVDEPTQMPIEDVLKPNVPVLVSKTRSRFWKFGSCYKGQAVIDSVVSITEEC